MCKKIAKCIISAIFLVVLSVAGATISQAASSPNYATSSVLSLGGYKGYVQCKASYSSGGLHARQGWLRYYITAGSSNDTGKLYTSFASSNTDTLVRSRTKIYKPSDGGYATFGYGFIWYDNNGSATSSIGAETE